MVRNKRMYDLDRCTYTSDIDMYKHGYGQAMPTLGACISPIFFSEISVIAIM